MRVKNVGKLGKRLCGLFIAPGKTENLPELRRTDVETAIAAGAEFRIVADEPKPKAKVKPKAVKPKVKASKPKVPQGD